MKVQPAGNPRQLPDEPPHETAKEPRTENEAGPDEQNPEAINPDLDERGDATENHKAVIAELPTVNELTDRELDTALSLQPISFCSHHIFCESKKKLVCRRDQDAGQAWRGTHEDRRFPPPYILR